MRWASISFDHPDPSIFLVLTLPSDTPGVSNIDFVIFPPRILAMQRYVPPALVPSQRRQRVHGADPGHLRRQGGGFPAGGASLHNSMSAHGPDAATFEKASRADLSQPEIIRDTMAFMFETRWVLHPTRHALESGLLQGDYHRCWQGLKRHFDPQRP